MRGSWQRRIDRAEHLAADGGPAASLLLFYTRLLRRQKAVYDSFNSRRPCGSLDLDLALVMSGCSALLRDVIEHGPEPLAVDARALLAMTDSTIADRLLTCWCTPSGCEFFPKAMLQPYGQWLADMRITPSDRSGMRTDNRCPFCGGVPQLSILETVSEATSADGGGRQLLCATCLTTWPFRRVLCAHCGEEDERRLGYFQSPAFSHLRVDACDTCQHYLKTVDLTRVGLAVPLVDEVAGGALDIWASEHGYEKIELNLLGL
ncbi:MAG TPA: formate dehydrogenase accessory protein FdhE [Vicinamibacterales bacterium]|jgi:FdhE protein